MLLGALPAAAQGTRTPAAPTAPRPAYDPALYSDGAKTNRAFKSLRWRNVGPSRGGRATAVTGDPTKPLVFYFGAVNGGVWKTTNAGQSWENITDGKTDLSSVGAITRTASSTAHFSENAKPGPSLSPSFTPAPSSPASHPTNRSLTTVSNREKFHANSVLMILQTQMDPIVDSSPRARD